MNEQNEAESLAVEAYTSKEVSFPDLSLGEETIAFLSKNLLGGGADDPAFENGESDKISDKLRSGKDGFFDKAKFPHTAGLIATRYV